MERFTHKEVQYEPHAKHMEHRCGNCKHFVVYGPDCKIVKPPINPGGWCVKWKAKN